AWEPCRQADVRHVLWDDVGRRAAPGRAFLPRSEFVLLDGLRFSQEHVSVPDCVRLETKDLDSKQPRPIREDMLFIVSNGRADDLGLVADEALGSRALGTPASCHAAMPPLRTAALGNP